MKRIVQCFFAFLAFVFLSTGAYAQITTSSLGGRITDDGGAAVAGVTLGCYSRSVRNQICSCH